MSILSKFDHLAADLRPTRTGGLQSAESHVRPHSVVDRRRGERPHQTILFGTNNYLGLTFDEGLHRSLGRRRCAASAPAPPARASPTAATAAIAIWKLSLAEFYGRKHGMVFSTGYQANLSMLSTLAGHGDHLILDSDSHASIYDGARLGHAEVIRFRHNDADDLHKRLRRLKDHPGSKLIVVEGIYSMLGDSAPLAEIAQVKREMGAYLLVDEAHSMGVLGETGRGLSQSAGVEADVDFIVGTFSKSLGSVGGFCVADIDGFEVLRVACRPYMFTASLPPAVIASTQEALRRLTQDSGLRVRLRDNAERLYDGLRALGFHVGPQASPIVSVTVDDNETAVRFWNLLLQGGLYVNLALPPATPTNKPLLRASISAAHTPRQIDTALALFADIGQRLGVLPTQTATPKVALVA
jgi:8-amino-7-oxononanoate synthase